MGVKKLGSLSAQVQMIKRLCSMQEDMELLRNIRFLRAILCKCQVVAFFAAPEDSSFELRMPGGCCSCFFGGEGIVVAITGDTTVFTQNRNPAIWKTILRREGAKKKQEGGST